tara:strand:- start:142 stop:351 length:210 start_codon:yes stop_codon:yes gene_type:complete
MNAAYKLYNQIIANCNSHNSAIEYLLKSVMTDKNGTLQVGNGYHQVIFNDKSAIMIGVNGIQICDNLSI